MIFSFDIKPDHSAPRLRSNLLFCICTAIIFCFLTVGVGSGFAGYSGAVNSTHDGGGTWGSILRLSVRVKDSTAVFTVMKKQGRFNTANTVTILIGSHNGSPAASGRIRPGTKAATLSVNLDNIAKFPQSFYARIGNSYGYAWVGPVQLSGQGYHASRPEQPVIDAQPEKAQINSRVSVAVAAGISRTCGTVQIECTAEDSDRAVKPYVSAPVSSGTTVRVPFTFYTPGKKIITCNTRDRCATSSKVKRTIKIKPQNREPFSPDIICSSAGATLNEPVTVTVVPGDDPDRDPVRVICAAENSDRTRHAPYVSDWTWSNSPVKAPLIFHSVGVKQITCITQDRKKAASSPAIENIRVRQGNRPPAQPKISLRLGYAEENRPVYISVLPGRDPDGDPVKVRCTAEDSDKNERTPYSSKLSRSRVPIDAGFSFYSSGTKKISCATYDSKGKESSPTGRTIQVGCGNTPENIFPDCGYRETQINIRVQDGGCNSSCEDEPEITFNAPYLPYDTTDRIFDRSPKSGNALYTLRGTVVYSNRAPVKGASVLIRNPQSGQQYTAVTDFYGQYALEIDRAGYYRILAVKNGLQSSVRRIYPDDDTQVTLQIIGNAASGEEDLQHYNNDFPSSYLP